jgi:hypothetical protein
MQVPFLILAGLMAIAAPQETVTAQGVNWQGDAKDPEANTTWNKAPTYVREADGTLRATCQQSSMMTYR